jgi:hypothetical protein
MPPGLVSPFSELLPLASDSTPYAGLRRIAHGRQRPSPPQLRKWAVDSLWGVRFPRNWLMPHWAGQQVDQ